MTATVEKRRRGPISESHREALREAQLRRWASPPTESVLPCVLLRLELIAARRAGLSFAEAWAPAVTAAVADAGKGRQNWLEVLADTRPNWEQAYRRDEGQRCWGTLE